MLRCATTGGAWPIMRPWAPEASRQWTFSDKRLSGRARRPRPARCSNGIYPLLFFLAEAAKFLILRCLHSENIPGRPQNIANKRLTCKILQNKWLAVFSRRWSPPSVTARSLLMRLRTIPLCATCILGQGCSSQGIIFFVVEDCGKRLVRSGLEVNEVIKPGHPRAILRIVASLYFPARAGKQRSMKLPRLALPISAHLRIPSGLPVRTKPLCGGRYRVGECESGWRWMR
jgi:hypothetical protein